MLGHRIDYSYGSLELENLDPNPILQLKHWLDEAGEAGIVEPSAMCLSTATPDGRPSGRMVLLRDIDDEGGLTFFTNYESRKGRELLDNSACAVTFWWASMQRQVRVEGSAERVSSETSDRYFASRPRDSQLASAVSPQSKPLADKTVLAEAMSALAQESNDAVPRPENWGGYRIVPDALEFWQGGVSRLHDRFCYRKIEDGWRIERLAP